jgi:hypothetical protein
MRRALRVATILAACVLVGACGARRRTDGLGTALALLDAAWVPERAGFEARTRARLEPLLRSAPDEPELLWRHARLLVAEALAEPEPSLARDRLALARAEATRCLERDPAFGRRRRDAGWAAALAVVPVARQRCIDQLAWSWVRWWVAADPVGMALDEPALRALARRATGPEAAWTVALFDAARSRGAEAEGAALVRVHAAAPADAALAADVIVWAGLPAAARADRLAELEASARPGVGRDTVALARARAALGR